MQIEINTDNYIIASETLTTEAKKKINNTLSRFSDHITRIEVHLSDLNGAKTGPADKRCLIEARVVGLNPVSVSHSASTLALAIDGAREKMANTLDTVFGKRDAARRDQVAQSEGTDAV